jgi:IMP cyclohydrolase
MYVGRIVVVGLKEGIGFGGYRVSSRSFPNRIAEVRGNSIFIQPKNPKEMLKNPYITYTCLKAGENFAVVSNGTHTDVIFDKLVEGYPPKDALILALLTMDYEKDEYFTPRIAGIITQKKVYLGFVGAEEIKVKGFSEGTYHVATYEHTDFAEIEIASDTAIDIAREMYHLQYEHPVCSAGVTVGEKVEIARYNP